ncbi:MAG: hypothetical protein LIO86_06530 [Lachnospiraceae bacterium]|nr:hypothetical protein [Lachnospiraceae bacterium]
MKKTYEEPSMECILFTAEDVITTSEATTTSDEIITSNVVEVEDLSE